MTGFERGLKLAVFDCDGTLVDSQHSIISGMRHSFATEGLECPDDESIRRIVGLSLEAATMKLLPGQSPEVYARLTTGYSDFWKQMRSSGTVDEPLYPGVIETLAELEQQGWLLGVATGKSRRGLEATLEKFGISDFFITLQTADQARGKPDPDMLHKAMAETGVDAASTVMIGDTTYDIVMSVNAGVLPIGVNWGYHQREELISSGAIDVVDDYQELKTLLNKLVEKRQWAAVSKSFQ